MYMLDGFQYNHMALHGIDLRTDSVAVIVIFDVHSYGMKLLGDNLLYFPQETKVTVFNLDTREETIVAGEDSSGSANGPFELTRFNEACGLLPWKNEVGILLLVTDCISKRHVSFL